MRVLWEHGALADLETIAERAPQAAAHLYGAVRWLSWLRFPAAFRRLAVGRPEHVLSLPPYTVIYGVDDDQLSVLALEDVRRRTRRAEVDRLARLLLTARPSPSPSPPLPAGAPGGLLPDRRRWAGR